MRHYKLPLLAWLTSVFIGPKLTLIFCKFLVTNELTFSTGYGKLYFFAVLIGGVLSAPCFYFLWLCYRMLLKKNAPFWFIRVALSLVSLLLCITLFILTPLTGFTKFWTKDSLILIGSYSLPLIVGIFVYKIETVSTDPYPS